MLRTVDANAEVLRRVLSDVISTLVDRRDRMATTEHTHAISPHTDRQ